MAFRCRYDLKGFSDDLGLPIEDISDLFSDFIMEINSEISKEKNILSEIILSKKSLTELERINHNIKGISANYRILDIYEETLKISDALRNVDVAYLKPLFDNFFVISENAVREIACYFEENCISLE